MSPSGSTTLMNLSRPTAVSSGQPPPGSPSSKSVRRNVTSGGKLPCRSSRSSIALCTSTMLWRIHLRRGRRDERRLARVGERRGREERSAHLRAAVSSSATDASWLSPTATVVTQQHAASGASARSAASWRATLGPAAGVVGPRMSSSSASSAWEFPFHSGNGPGLHRGSTGASKRTVDGGWVVAASASPPRTEGLGSVDIAADRSAAYQAPSLRPSRRASRPSWRLCRSTMARDHEFMREFEPFTTNLEFSRF